MKGFGRGKKRRDQAQVPENPAMTFNINSRDESAPKNTKPKAEKKPKHEPPYDEIYAELKVAHDESNKIWIALFYEICYIVGERI